MPSRPIGTPKWRTLDQEPRAGVHYPRNELHFATWFPDEAVARQYLEAVRFRHGAHCPRCGVLEPSRRSSTTWWCRDCRRSFTLTAKTAMEHTRLPLLTWLRVVWAMTNSKSGVSALSLSRAMQLNYTTALYVTHKVRWAMAHSGEKLHCTVEMDETFVGGHEPGGAGAQRATSNKACVLIAVEQVRYTDAKTGTSKVRAGRARMRRVYTNLPWVLARFIEDNIEPDSTLVTDGNENYKTALRWLAHEGVAYTHKAHNLTATGVQAHTVLPTVHRAASLLKRWHGGTHQGAVREHQLDAYLDEFVFRYNRRASASRGLVFWRLVCALMTTQSVSQDEIAARKGMLADDDAMVSLIARAVSDELHREKHRAHQAAYEARVRAAQRVSRR